MGRNFARSNADLACLFGGIITIIQPAVALLPFILFAQVSAVDALAFIVELGGVQAGLALLFSVVLGGIILYGTRLAQPMKTRRRGAIVVLAAAVAAIAMKAGFVGPLIAIVGVAGIWRASRKK